MSKARNILRNKWVLILILNFTGFIGHSSEEIIVTICTSYEDGLDAGLLVQESVLLEKYEIEAIALGDVLFHGNEDAVVVFRDLATDERFMGIFEFNGNSTYLPHSFAFGQLPCFGCDGILGGYFNITVENHIINVPFFTGSNTGTFTQLQYQLNPETIMVELIGKEYEEFNRNEGTVTFKSTMDYLTGKYLENDAVYPMEVTEREAFQYCILHDAPPLPEAIRYVFRPDVPILMEPDINGAELTEVSYGEPVELLELGDYVKVDGVSGRWARIMYGHMVGYIFDPFILPVPPPMQDRTGIEMYMRNIPETGELFSEFKDENGRVFEKSWRHKYGLKYIERYFKFSDEYTVTEFHLYAENLTLFQGWLLACAIINEMDREYPFVGENEILDENYYQMISVKKTGTGVEIFYPERAD